MFGNHGNSRPWLSFMTVKNPGACGTCYIRTSGNGGIESSLLCLPRRLLYTVVILNCRQDCHSMDR